MAMTFVCDMMATYASIRKLWTGYSEREHEVDLYLSVADAARILDVTPQMVRLMIRTGKLVVNARTVGGIQLFRREEVEQLARERARRRAAAS
jgi:hypothetical protein